MGELNLLVPRVVDADPTTQLFTMAHLVVATPCPIERVEAIAVMPGLGEHDRIIAAVNAWESNPNAKHLLVAGTNDVEKTQPQPSTEFLQGDPIRLQRTDGVHTQVAAEHTPDQVQWLLERIQTLHVASLALYVSHWHLPRAYGTLVKAMMQLGEDNLIPIFPMPVAMPPNALVPDTHSTVATMSAGEAKRIEKYQGLGDVATLAEMEGYLNWLWQQQVVPISRVVRNA